MTDDQIKSLNVLKSLPTESVRISSFYGYRTDPVTGKKNTFHSGVDIAVSGKFLSPFKGVVTHADFNDIMGYYVVVEYYTKYKGIYIRIKGQHLKKGSIKVKVGDKVTAGQELGTVGSTGKSTGVHLHFEVHLSEDDKTWTTVNPLSFITNFTSEPITHTISNSNNTGYVLEIVRLQQLLNSNINTLKLTEDGMMGNNTVHGIKEFQRKYELTVDGIFGAKCLSKMKELYKDLTPVRGRNKG